MKRIILRQLGLLLAMALIFSVLYSMLQLAVQGYVRIW